VTNQVSNVLIAPFKTGLEQDVAPWLAPFDSFEELNNFHLHNGYIQKRSGYKVFGYMVHNPVATITGASQANPCVITAVNTFVNGQQILITNVNGMTELNGNIYTVANQNAVSFELQGVDSTGYTLYVNGGRAATFTADRIMGIARYFAADGSKQTLIFDDKRAALYDGANSRFNPLDVADIMAGSDIDYVWFENWQHSNSTNRLYFTNGQQYDGVSIDGIRYYDQSFSTTATVLFTPLLGGTRILYGSRLIFAIKQRLLVLNTFEHDTGTGTTSNFPQRARWCQAQAPGNWDDTIPGGGGFVDAPTGQQIISARALQDTIIVFFTDSVWMIRPVPDPALPFRWDKINDFRACDGKMATVQYDKYVIALGVRGITATDGSGSQRVDNRIESFTVDDVNVDYFGKVFCQRNYALKRWWSLYPGNESTENTNALILDDESSGFSKYEIAMNCLGFGNFSSDYSLDDFIAANDLDVSLIDLNNETLQSYFWQENAEAFLGGDIAGTIYIMQTEGSDNGTDIDCNLLTNAWNPYQNEGIEAQLHYVDLFVEVEKKTQLTVSFYKDTNVNPYVTRLTDILPPLGFISEVANITNANPAVVTANEHGLTTGNVIYIYGVQGMVEIDDAYTVTVIDNDNFSLDGIDSTLFSVYVTGGQVCERKFYRTKSWKRIIAGGIGFQHRMSISSSGSNTPLRIDAFKPMFKPRGRRLIN